MSNSVKHNPAGGWTTAISEKRDKELWHRSFRRTNKMYCDKQESFHEVYIYLDLNNYIKGYCKAEWEIMNNYGYDTWDYRHQCAPTEQDKSDVWVMNKDGKGWHDITGYLDFDMCLITSPWVPPKTYRHKLKYKTSRRGRIKYKTNNKYMRK